MTTTIREPATPASSPPGAEPTFLAYLRAREAARFMGLGRSTFLKHVQNGTAPAGFRVGGARVWAIADLHRWVEGA